MLLAKCVFILDISTIDPGVDPGFLEREFICIKVRGFALLNLSIVLKYCMKMK